MFIPNAGVVAVGVVVVLLIVLWLKLLFVVARVMSVMFKLWWLSKGVCWLICCWAGCGGSKAICFSPECCVAILGWLEVVTAFAVEISAQMGFLEEDVVVVKVLEIPSLNLSPCDVVMFLTKWLLW